MIQVRRLGPQIGAEIQLMGVNPATLTHDQMVALTRKYDVEHVYFIDRTHRVFQTDLQADLNLQFPESEFNEKAVSPVGAMGLTAFLLYRSFRKRDWL